MSNVKHPKCALRTLAGQAKARLSKGSYGEEPSAPKNVTPRQREIYIKLCELAASGEEVTNPIALFADKQLLASLPHEEKQRYILQLCADYISMRNMLDDDNIKRQPQRNL